MSEPKALSSLIQQIYDAGLDEALWRPTMDSVRSFIGAENFHLHLRMPAQGLARSLATNFSESFQRKYTEHWWQFDPRGSSYFQVPMEKVYINTTLVPKAEYVKSDIYNQLARPEGGALYLMGGSFKIGPDEFGVIGL